MRRDRSLGRLAVRLAAAVVLLAGCHGVPVAQTPVPDVPRELAKVTHPPYTIETPDVLLVDALRVVPLPPFRIGPFDVLNIVASNSLPNEPIGGIYTVEPEGIINLGPSYGTVTVVDMTLEDARIAIEKALKRIVRDVQVSVSLAEYRGKQQIRGEHLVRPDGTISLGLYGAVTVVGLTVDQARQAIESHLSNYLLKPEVSVDIAGYNSKVYYVIFDGGGFGEQVVRLPATGNETVLDAIGQLGGISGVGSRKRIWLARPAPAGQCPDQILPVDWNSIARGGRTATNYQVLPGDRVYVMAEPLITTDVWLSRILAPWERTFGFILLGNGTVQSLRGGNNNGGGFGGGF